MTISFPGDSADYRAARDRLPASELCGARRAVPRFRGSNFLTIVVGDQRAKITLRLAGGKDHVALPTGQETCIGLTVVSAAERGARRVARDAFPLLAGAAIDWQPHVAAARLNQQQANSVEGDWAQIARLA